MNQSKKIIFMDIDGTLINYDGVFPDSAKEAIRRARDNGHIAVICTGRGAAMLPAAVKEGVEFDGIISSAGAVGIYNGKELFHYYIEEQKCRQLVDYLNKNDFVYVYQTGKGYFITHENKERMRKIVLSLGMDEDDNSPEKKGWHLCDKITDFIWTEKVFYYDAPFTLEQVQNDLMPDFKVTDMSFIRAGERFGEITRRTVNKASGIQEYISRLNIDHSDTIAVGDSGNDLEMLEYVHMSVAMGNATEKLKSAASYITKPVDEDGIYAAFEHLGLI